jgi:hypothetical protein
LIGVLRLNELIEIKKTVAGASRLRKHGRVDAMRPNQAMSGL